MHWMTWSNGGWMNMGFMAVFWIAVIIGVVVLLGRYGGGDRSAGRGSKDPERILKERYARGEIDRGEYEKMLDELRR